MKNKLYSVSMNGRMAYTIMCVEAYLQAKYPERDWTIVSEIMWKATSTNWGNWVDEFSIIIPDVFMQYKNYDIEEMGCYLNKNQFLELRKLYKGITAGLEDNPEDEVNYMLNKPYEIAMVYEGTVIGDGQESFDIISNAEAILNKYKITLPDYKKVLFSSKEELNGWGNDFDGKYLSIILS